MKRAFLAICLLLACASIASAQDTNSPQRVHPTTLNPPTSCVPSHFYTNASVGKSWLGKSDNSCEPVNSGGTPVDGTGTANQVSKFIAAQTLGNSGITDDGTTDTFKLTETTPVAPTAALVVTGTGNCTAGAHLFKVTVVTASGETAASSASGSVTCDGTHKQVTVTIPVGSAVATGRNIYATKAAGSTYFLIATGPVVADNTTVTYTFNIADASFTATIAPTTNTAIDARLTIGQSTVTVAKNLTVGGTCTGCGVSNSAGANVIPKSNGTNLVASRLGDAGTAANITINSDSAQTVIGDTSGAANSTTLTVDDSLQIVTLGGGGSFGSTTPGQWSLGGGGYPFANLTLGNNATNNFQISGTATAARVVTLPDATGTVGILLTNTATLDFANLAAIGCEDLTIGVTGAALSDTVALGVPNGSIVANGTFFAWVSATNVVTVRFCTVVSGNPASGTFKVDVFKH